jgi:NitT/TauT family transport system ATP-binding protein
MSMDASVLARPAETKPVQPTISVHGLWKIFRHESGRDVEALRDVSFDVPDGQLVCLVGPSGHGKTTLLNVIAGLLAPTRGEILVRGRKVVGPGADRGLVFQQDTLFLWRRVKGNVAYGLEARRVPKADRERIVAEYLRLVGLTENANFWPKELSGGMRKRVAVAAVFANNPDVLLMDEPFGSLDYVQRSHLHDVLLDLWQRTHKTILFVTHDVEEALVLADRIIVIANGQLVDDIAVQFPRPRGEQTLALPAAIDIRKRMLEHLGISVSAHQRLRDARPTT